MCKVNNHLERLPCIHRLTSTRRPRLSRHRSDRCIKRQLPCRNERECRRGIERINATRHAQRHLVSLSIKQQCPILRNIKINHANPRPLCCGNKRCKCRISTTNHHQRLKLRRPACSGSTNTIDKQQFRLPILLNRSVEIKVV